MKQTRIIDISTEVSEAELRKLAEESTQQQEKPRTLALADIHVADRFFQRRDMTANRVEHDVHARELIRVLKDTGKAFVPLVVTPIGGRFYLLDGHYRLTAYRSTGWSRRVTVEVFTGTLDEAWSESLRLNVESKRPMSLADKLEAAWTLTVRGKHTKAHVAQACAVSEGTVRNMRCRAKELREDGQDPAGLSWSQAKHLGPKEELAEEDWLERQASEWAERFVRNHGSKPRERPDILALMLSKVDAGLPRALIGQWRVEVRDLVEEWDAEEAEAPF